MTCSRGLGCSASPPPCLPVQIPHCEFSHYSWEKIFRSLVCSKPPSIRKSLITSACWKTSRVPDAGSHGEGASQCDRMPRGRQRVTGLCVQWVCDESSQGQPRWGGPPAGPVGASDCGALWLCACIAGALHEIQVEPASQGGLRGNRGGGASAWKPCRLSWLNSTPNAPPPSQHPLRSRASLLGARIHCTQRHKPPQRHGGFRAHLVLDPGLDGRGGRVQS